MQPVQQDNMSERSLSSGWGSAASRGQLKFEGLTLESLAFLD
ncbi:hypothetical protein [Laspinema olomoucense]|nr:hypothetical protein [Laspinema sp. D3a]